MKIHALTLFFTALALSGCAQPPIETVRIVEIPSSKPYKFLTFSSKDDPQTIRGIRAHNRAHQAVLNAEKRAADQK